MQMLAGLFILITFFSMVALVIALIPLKIYGLVVIVQLLIGSVSFGSLSTLQAIALVSLIIPLKFTVKEKK